MMTLEEAWKIQGNIDKDLCARKYANDESTQQRLQRISIYISNSIRTRTAFKVIITKTDQDFLKEYGYL